MSNDIAKIIVEHLKNDKNLDGLELQEMFKKKVKLDGESIREKLKEIVSNHIKTNAQPANSKITLTSAMVNGGSNIVARSVNPSHQSNGFDKSDYIYVYKKASFEWIYIEDENTRQLIREAIIPLNLKWKCTYSDNTRGYVIEVSWSHWDYE